MSCSCVPIKAFHLIDIHEMSSNSFNSFNVFQILTYVTLRYFTAHSKYRLIAVYLNQKLSKYKFVVSLTAVTKEAHPTHKTTVQNVLQCNGK